MWQKLDKWFDELNNKTQKIKDRCLQPIIFYLGKMGFTANGLSTLKVVMAGVAVVIVKWNLVVAVIIFLVTYILDVFDGSLARHTKQNTDRGKFIDVLTDQAVYVLVILALIQIDFLDIKLLAFNLLVIPVLYLLVVVERNENKPTDWIIKPVAKLSYYKIPFLIMVVGVMVGVFSFGLAYWVLYITNILVSLHIIYAYARIIRKVKEPIV